jgi:hypothetical protein
MLHFLQHRSVLTVTHTVAEQPARQAIGTAVDGTVHLFIGAAAGEEFGQFAADHGIFVVPTLIVLRALLARGSEPIRR